MNRELRSPGDRSSATGNLPDARALLRMGRAMIKQEAKRIMLDIDDTFDAVHGGQQLRLFNAHYDEYGFQPIVVFDDEAASSLPLFVPCPQSFRNRNGSGQSGVSRCKKGRSAE
jgi:hypothetical protein